MSALDDITQRAFALGWFAAINACRERLPPDHSLGLRDLYDAVPDLNSERKITPPALLASHQKLFNQKETP